MTSSGCAGMDHELLGRNVDEVVDDSVHHHYFTLLTAMLKIFPSYILNHGSDTASSEVVIFIYGKKLLLLFSHTAIL